MSQRQLRELSKQGRERWGWSFIQSVADLRDTQRIWESPDLWLIVNSGVWGVDFVSENILIRQVYSALVQWFCCATIWKKMCVIHYYLVTMYALLTLSFYTNWIKVNLWQFLWTVTITEYFRNSEKCCMCKLWEVSKKKLWIYCKFTN